MKAFGLELRKQGSHSVYADVDLVLSKNGIIDSGVSAEVQKQALAHSLQKMMSASNWFDVCTIKNAINLCQIVIPIERIRVYESIHCVHWSEMQPEFRELICAMVLDDFRGILCG